MWVSAAGMMKKMDQSKKWYTKIYNNKVLELRKIINTKNKFDQPNKYFEILYHSICAKTVQKKE